jgi:predicted phosphodiesterase
MKFNSILAISDIHFQDKKYIFNYDINYNKFDIFIYAGDIIRSGKNIENSISYAIEFFNHIKVKNKIIILGNNDSDYLYNILKKKLNNIDYNIYLVNNKKSLNNIFCSIYSKTHYTTNNYGQDQLYKITKSDLLKHDIFITHGYPFDESMKNIDFCKNKLFIFGHDHIYNNKSKKFIYFYENNFNNKFINVSTSNGCGKNDRDVIFTYFNIEKNKINLLHDYKKFKMIVNKKENTISIYIKYY